MATDGPKRLYKGEQKSERPYPLLCEAVVERACKDYRHALIMKHRKERALIDGDEDAYYRGMYADDTIRECEQFFEDDIAIWSDLDGDWLMKQIRLMAEEEEKDV